VMTYGDADELARRVEDLLGDDASAVRVARAGQRRTLDEHTYAHRMQELIPILERHAP